MANWFSKNAFCNLKTGFLYTIPVLMLKLLLSLALRCLHWIMLGFADLPMLMAASIRICINAKIVANAAGFARTFLCRPGLCALLDCAPEFCWQKMKAVIGGSIGEKKNENN